MSTLSSIVEQSLYFQVETESVLTLEVVKLIFPSTFPGENPLD